MLYRITGLARDAELPASGLPNDRFYIAPALTIKPSSDTTLTLLSHYLRVRDGSSYGSFPEAGTLQPNPNGKFSPKTYVGEPGFDRFNQEQWMVGYMLEHRFNDTWTVRQNARYGYTSVDYRQVYVRGFATVDADNPSDPSNFRLLDRYPFGSNENARLFTIDNQAQAKLRLGDWQHTFLAGLDYQHSRNYQATYNDGTVGPIDGYSPVHGSPVNPADPWFDGTTRLAQTGFYLQDQIKWGNWVATLGGRYDRASADVSSNIDGSRTKVDEHNFSGRGGLVYLHPSGIAPYFSYAESFSPTATIDPVTNSPMKPETGRQYEVGVRYEPPGGTSRYSVAAFDLRRRNYITYTEDFLPKQTGEVQVRGLEFEAGFRPVPQMNVVAAYTYTPKADVTASSTPSEVGQADAGSVAQPVCAVDRLPLRVGHQGGRRRALHRTQPGLRRIRIEKTAGLHADRRDGRLSDSALESGAECAQPDQQDLSEQLQPGRLPLRRPAYGAGDRHLPLVVRH